MIAMGNQFGGPEQRGSVIASMLNKAMNVAADLRDSSYNDGKNAWINPIYIVPGSILKPDFEGYKLGHFSKKQKGLVVMIAVPPSVADGLNIPEFVGSSLREAVRLAAAFFDKKGISFSAQSAEGLILAIEDELHKMVVENKAGKLPIS